MSDSYKSRSSLKVGGQVYEYWNLGALPQAKVARLPYSLKILLENLLRFEDGVNVTRRDIDALLYTAGAGFCGTCQGCGEGFGGPSTTCYSCNGTGLERGDA